MTSFRGLVHDNHGGKQTCGTGVSGRGACIFEVSKFTPMVLQQDHAHHNKVLLPIPFQIVPLFECQSIHIRVCRAILIQTTTQGFCCVDRAGSGIFLPLPLRCWDYRCVLLPCRTWLSDLGCQVQK